MAFFISHTSAVPTDEALVDAYSDFVSSSVAATHPAVVHIEVQGTYPGRSGSGFFISPEGYILTNSHVVHGSRERRVFLADGRKLAADRIGERAIVTFLRGGEVRPHAIIPLEMPGRRSD